MLQSSTLKFLKDLKKNNNKPWFDENRKIYELAKQDFISMVEKLITGIAKFDAPIGILKAKDCIFRINRDIRFSKDKSPYKTNMGAFFTRNGKKSPDAGYYIHCEPGQSFIGGGLYLPMSPLLAKARQEIDYNFDEWKKIVNNKNFKKYFPEGVDGIEVLSRPPKGYADDNPAIEFLKMKSFIVSHAAEDNLLTDKNSTSNILQSFAAMKPFLDFLNNAIE
ncbi:DUF2461 domain-containing protein [Ferruginibacter albus]|uniref:DUF2461 domain-containing protein n=1 Tax=Ferruginibacter albus TaxID=2875540 RepID=UPI001CC7C02C|nr:DUF2461 domain-containing protein [Ferruginibacter albus]UAY52287.1 DUF2461 domain-containing protein [Ferruginibacter albus]